MIPRKILNKIYLGTCAIGYHTMPIEEYKRDPFERGFEVIGTGFLIRNNIVMTNRHVLTNLIDFQRDNDYPTNRFSIRFLYPKQDDWTEIVIPIGRTSMLNQEEFDIGIIQFIRKEDKDFDQCKPLTIAENFSLFPSQQVGVVGFPYGTDSLIHPFSHVKKVYRVGPVLQQGYISAIAPFNNHPKPSKILLDVRTAQGMSGAAVFRPDSGEIIAIHEGGREATMAYAIPLTRKMVNEIIEICFKSEPLPLPSKDTSGE